MMQAERGFWRHPALLVFVATVGGGALLLFVLEPLVGKWVLPILGGAPAVWNTCLMFFQAALLAGYAWVHFGTRWLGVRRHAIAHALIVLTSLALLPPRLPARLLENAADSPVPSLVAILAISVGLPFFVITTTAPLVQKWLSRTRYPSASDPYYLYAASNFGSLAGLLAYPFLIEPTIGLSAQRTGWTTAYLGYLVLLILSGFLAWRGARNEGPEADIVHDPGTGRGTAPSWVFRAFVPSALLLTVTSFVTTDIAPVPLLWIVPLSLYLGSFIVAFGRPASRLIDIAALIQVPLFVLIGMLLVLQRHPAWEMWAHLLFLAVTAYVAHGALARDRPPTDRLTAYYLWISLGGALGGIFIVFVAPYLFRSTTEYLVLLVLAALARPPVPGTRITAKRYAYALAAVAAIVITVRIVDPGSVPRYLAAAPVFLITAIAVTRLQSRPATLATTLALGFTAFRLLIPPGGTLLAEERNFFGTTSVIATDELHIMRHGRTLHGVAFTDPARRTEPTAYYNRAGPFGEAFMALAPQDGTIGVVGLGAGTTACYATPGQSWEFFEINPSVTRFATDTTLFRFLSDCTPEAPIHPGDARLRLSESDDARYDVLILDAFSSDAVPVHLITREAFRLYERRLRNAGAIIVNVTNTYMDLEPVIADHARQLGLHALIRRDPVVPSPERVPSDWMILAREAEPIERLEATGDWDPPRREPGFRPWTDDFSNVLSVLALRFW